jgi:hypothetical protein
MSNNRNATHNDSTARRIAIETKQAFKTTEFFAWIAVSLAILVASAMVDNGEDGQGFGADHAWQYVAFVTVAYIISRGIAKSGSHGHERNND